MPSILFVCTANICRSPMAAKIFQQIATELDYLTTWKVESAGTWADDGQQASENAQIVLASIGLDLSEHHSQSVMNVSIENYDLILTMERGHKEGLQAEFPTLADRIYMLSEMIGSTFDVADPYGGAIDDYKNTVVFIEDLLRKGYPKIRALSSNPG